jgi:hypothetical protein
MSRMSYHVTPSGSGWSVRRAGAARADSIHDNKPDAITRAKDLATRGALGQVKVHRRDGEIQTEYTYGRDPRRLRG